jgi:hypothetical protein
MQRRRMKVMESSSLDAVFDAYMRDVDVTLLIENLKLTPTQRVEQLMSMQRFVEELQRAGREARQRDKSVQK